MRTLVLIHSLRSVAAAFEPLAREVLGAGVDVVHIVDEILLRDLLAHGRITPFVRRHVARLVAEAREFGADAVLLTCSSLAPCVDDASAGPGVPVFRVDGAMVEKALSLGPRIGILATTGLAAGPIGELVRAVAAERKQSITVETVVCAPRAYEAMLAGDKAAHDALVREELARLAARTDVVMLAQVSMAGVLDNGGCADLRAAVLASPRLALEQVGAILGGRGP